MYKIKRVSSYSLSLFFILILFVSFLCTYQFSSSPSTNKPKLLVHAARTLHSFYGTVNITSCFFTKMPFFSATIVRDSVRDCKYLP